LTDFRNFFTTIFSKELRNKNLLKFSPHLKSGQLSYSLPLEVCCVMMCSAMTQERSHHSSDLISSHLIQTQMNWTADPIKFK